MRVESTEPVMRAAEERKRRGQVGRNPNGNRLAVKTKRQETQNRRCDTRESETVESRCEASKSHIEQRNQSDQNKGQRLDLHREEVFKR